MDFVRIVFAKALGVAPGTVRSLVTRARHVLSANLARLAQEEGTLTRRTPSSSEMADDLLREPLSRENPAQSATVTRR